MSTNSSIEWTARYRLVTLYIFRPTVAIDLYRLFRSWGAGRGTCLVSALQCERAGRARWRTILREDLREMPEATR